MNKRNEYYDKLDKIKRDHFKLLEMVRDSIRDDGINLGDNITGVFSAIMFDAKQIDKYKVLLEARFSIENLVEMILCATTPEDVAKIREQLNCYIDKIKREIVSRKMSDVSLASYQSRASNLRKDIAKCIRVLKRENNIDTIEGLVMLSDVIVPDDDQTLKSMIKNEMQFNDYYLNPDKKTKTKTVTVINSVADSNKTDEISAVQNDNNNENNVLPNSSQSNKTDKIDENFEVIFSSLKNKLGFETQTSEVEDFANSFKPLLTGEPIKKVGQSTPSKKDDTKSISKRAYLSKMVERYSKQYHLDDLRRYDGSTGKNVFRFFGNLPAYIYNKVIVQDMDYDSSIFYNGNDFVSFIEYNRRRNSIRNALKSVFSKSYLLSFEGQCLNNHERCVNWIEAYCKENGLEIDGLQQGLSLL